MSRGANRRDSVRGEKKVCSEYLHMMLIWNISLSLIEVTEYFLIILEDRFLLQSMLCEEELSKESNWYRLFEHYRHRRQVCCLYWMYCLGLWNWHAFYKSSQTTKIRFMQFWKLWEEGTISPIVTTSYTAENLDLWNAFYEVSHYSSSVFVSFFNFAYLDWR